MFSYLLLALSLTAISLLVIILLKLELPSFKLLLTIFLILAVAMLVFDTYLTALAVVLYNNKSILGLKIGSIPVEDLSYLIAVVLLIPALFEFFHYDKKS